MSEMNDGIDDVVEGQMRVMMTAAMQAGEAFARAREDSRRQMEAARDADRRSLEARFKAERATARLQLQPVTTDQWWQHAQPRDVAHHLELATSWQEHDDVAHAAAERIRRELAARQVDLPDHAQAVNEQRAAAHNDREEARQLLSEAEHSRQEQAGAAHEPDRNDGQPAAAPDNHPAAFREADARDKALLAWDSSERRDELAQRLSSKGIDARLIEPRLRADLTQALPPAAAVSARAANTPRSRGRVSRSIPRREPELGR